MQGGPRGLIGSGVGVLRARAVRRTRPDSPGPGSARHFRPSSRFPPTRSATPPSISRVALRLHLHEVPPSLHEPATGAPRPPWPAGWSCRAEPLPPLSGLLLCVRDGPGDGGASKWAAPTGACTRPDQTLRAQSPPAPPVQPCACWRPRTPALHCHGQLVRRKNSANWLRLTRSSPGSRGPPGLSR